MLRVIPMMKQTRILLFPPARGTAEAQSPEEIKKRLGAEVVAVPEKEFDAMIDAAEGEAVKTEIDRWTKEAKEIVEPTAEDIAKAAKVSVALQRLVEREKAQGLAIGTCMGWLPKGPCWALRVCGSWDSGGVRGGHGFAVDDDPVWICDRQAGFQGNATFDTSRNAVDAHCTPLKMDGLNGGCATSCVVIRRWAAADACRRFSIA